jgi:hypothetical protein
MMRAIRVELLIDFVFKFLMLGFEQNRQEISPTYQNPEQQYWQRPRKAVSSKSQRV